MNVVFDLDGTLLDSRLRLFTLFQELVPESVLSFDAYWNMKRQGEAHEHILKREFAYCKSRRLYFERKWMERIEAPDLLELDTPFHGLHRYLDGLRPLAALFVATARQSESRAIKQLDALGLRQYFAGVFVTGQRQAKSDLLRNSLCLCSADWIVGDTGSDICAGRDLGVSVCAVLSGFHGKQTLQRYAPDRIVRVVTEFQPNNL